VEGLVFQERAAGTVKKIEKAKIGLIQFQVSPPKTDMDNQVKAAVKPFFVELLLYRMDLCYHIINVLDLLF
jgi:hypothetical protein